ncbi:MAG: ribonuclease R [Phycisphaera sp.]|nr:ribonuclease R [Phycisphaera sp.]
MPNDNPDRLTQRILHHIADKRYQPRQADELARELNIESDAYDDFKRSVQHLIDSGQVIHSATQTLTLPPPGRIMVGVFRLNPRGFGFIQPASPTEHGDLFVPEGSTAGALTGDHVRARVIHQPRRAGSGDRSPFVGKIIEIIQRADNRYVGNLTKRGSQWIVVVDGKTLAQPVVIRDPHAKDAKAGDKVVIELIEYPSDNELAEGVITEVLGEQGEPEVETLAVMRAFGLPDKFDQKVIDEARRVSSHDFGFDPHNVPPNREDLTTQYICTIDPPDARDYDDAISIERNDQGFELGVHIADVSFFVTPGSPLDVEAKERGNSCYLPRKVIPMLPEVLSNGVCSLQEGVNRYTKSCFIRYDRGAKVLGARFAKTVIRSAKRLTYLEAQALIDRDIREARKHSKSESKYNDTLFEKLALMDELAKLIRTRRQKQGMIELALPEVDLVFDDSGRVVDAQPEDDAFTHKLIEMFMVEANEAAARVFNNLNIPMIRRTHPDPPSHDLSDLRRFARVAGFNVPSHPSRHELQALLESVRGKPAEYAVHLAVLQTLSKAEYSPDLVGHFALASEHYTHFTSPIRRYPDLIVHRGLDAYIEASKQHDSKQAVARAMADDPRIPSEDELHQLGSQCSSTERNAEAAERNLRYYFVLDLLSSKLGEDFDATVTGITGSGIFLQIDRFLVDGFIRISELPSSERDVWRLNRTTGALVAQRSGKTISIGDRFVVRIAKVRPEGRLLELVIISAKRTGTPPPEVQNKPREQRGVKKPHRQPKGAAKAHEKTKNFKQQSSKRNKRNKRKR